MPPGEKILWKNRERSQNPLGLSQSTVLKEGEIMKKVLNWIKTTITVIVWVLIILIYGIYNTIIVVVESIILSIILLFSGIDKAIRLIIYRSMKFFHGSIKSLQMFILELVNSIIHR